MGLDLNLISVDYVETTFGWHAVKSDTRAPTMPLQIDEWDGKHASRRAGQGSPLKILLHTTVSNVAVRV